MSRFSLAHAVSTMKGQVKLWHERSGVSLRLHDKFVEVGTFKVTCRVVPLVFRRQTSRIGKIAGILMIRPPSHHCNYENMGLNAVTVWNFEGKRSQHERFFVKLPYFCRRPPSTWARTFLKRQWWKALWTVRTRGSLPLGHRRAGEYCTFWENNLRRGFTEETRTGTMFGDCVYVCFCSVKSPVSGYWSTITIIICRHTPKARIP